MSDVLDILGDIKNDTTYSQPKPETLVEEDHTLNKLGEELKDLSVQSAHKTALESVRGEKAISKALALEIFTMLPNPSTKISNKLTESPSAHNRELLLNSSTGYANFSNQYSSFIREIRDIVRDNFKLQDELVASCTTFLDVTTTMITELVFCNPTIAHEGRIYKLLDYDATKIVHMTGDPSSNSKRNINVSYKYRMLIDSVSFDDISRQKGFKTADKDDSLGITVVDVVDYLTSIAKNVVARSNELAVIHHNLEELVSSEKVNPSIPSVYFESIFETLAAVKSNSVLFTAPYNTANAVVALLKFLD